MKKIQIFLMFLLAAQFMMPLHSEETTLHDNRLYIAIGESDDITRIPLTLYLENPAADITALELYLELPEWVTLTEGSLDSHRCSDHELTQGNTSEGYFISVVSPELTSIAGSSGAICTWMIDASLMGEGVYNVDAHGVFAVGVDEQGISSYHSDNQTAQYVIDLGTGTGIEGVESSTEVSKSIFNLNGQRLSTPQQNAINIINGKKVLLRKI